MNYRLSKEDNRLTREDLKNWYEVNDYVFLDLETTGFSYKSGSKIIEIAAYRVQNGEVVDKFGTLVNPKVPIPEDLTRHVHGISDDMVKWKDTIEVVMPQFYQFFGALPLMSHNARFDIGSFLRPMLKDMYNYDLPNIVMCTLVASKALAKGVSHKLPDMYNFCTGKEHLHKHRAETDVAMGVEVANYIQKFVRSNYEALYHHLK